MVKQKSDSTITDMDSVDLVDSVDSIKENPEVSVSNMSTSLKRRKINRTGDLSLKLEELKSTMWYTKGDETRYVDTLLEIDGNSLIDNLNPEDEIAREKLFIDRATELVKKAHSKLDNENIKRKRPDDYFAEMVKTDKHMKKIRSYLLEEKERIMRSEKRRSEREMKKYAKQVQAEKIQERNKQRNMEMERIKNIRNRRALDGGGAEAYTDFDELFNVGADKSNSKRQRKDEKYGYGGKKGKNRKSNDFSSSTNMKGFKTGTKSLKKRPGKSVRQKQKSRK